MKSRVIVGAGAGLGKWLSGHQEARPFVRGSAADMIGEADTVVFCAARAMQKTPPEALYQAIEDNFLLLDRIVKRPHQKFIYISSIDVYPPSRVQCHEEDPVMIEELAGGYPAFKLMSEAAVQHHARDWCILRPASLFGQAMRDNTIMRLFRQPEQKPGLAADSRFNIVTWEMIGSLVDLVIDKNVTGIVNAVAGQNITLKDIASIAGYDGVFGSHLYDPGTLDNGKAAGLCPAFDRSSKDVLMEFLRSEGFV